MTPDEKHRQYYNDDYKRGFKEGKEHSSPSPETKEFMIQMNMELKYIKEKIEEISNKIVTKDEMERCNLELVEKILEKTDKRYATKLTEKIVYAMTGIVLTAVLVAVVGLVVYNTSSF
jgi:hypothetical protein